MLDQIVAKSPNQSAMGTANIRRYRRGYHQQRGTSGIEHRVIGSIGCTIHVATIKQGAR